MPECSNVIYEYDGSFEGLLCCVFESVYSKELPVQIVCFGDTQPSFYTHKSVITNSEKAMRVYNSIPTKMGYTAAELVQTMFLSCATEKEIKIFRFLLFGYKQGMKTMHLLSHPCVTPLLTAQLSLKNEVHLLTGFVRFVDTGDALIAKISPKNYVLPFLKNHFCTRFALEDFLIYDNVHKAALIYNGGKAEIVSLDSLEIPEETLEEIKYQELWKRFYKTVSIAARENPKCRMSHMPKRYWENMLEVREELKRVPYSSKKALLQEVI